MNIEDIFLPPPYFQSQSWQFGANLKKEVPKGGITIFVVPDYRGVGARNASADTAPFRKELYKLAAADTGIPIADLGDLVVGKSAEDTHQIVAEVAAHCFKNKSIPIIIGGSDDLIYPAISALDDGAGALSMSYVSDSITLSEHGADNYLYRLLSSSRLVVKNFHLIGYQQHLVNPETISLIREVRLDTVRLAELMGSVQAAEPYLRHADVFSVNCSAVENPGASFATNPQVNGLNRREICGLMKEAGLGKKLQAAGIFNYNFNDYSQAGAQLLAQMVWYLVDGICIRRTHPENENYETFWVMANGAEYAFQHGVFSGLWYFGQDENPDNWIPCTRQDYEDAKKGDLNIRFL